MAQRTSCDTEPIAARQVWQLHARKLLETTFFDFVYSIDSFNPFVYCCSNLGFRWPSTLLDLLAALHMQKR